MDKTAVLVAVKQIATHPEVLWVGDPAFSAGRARVEFDIDLGFGRRWAVEGKSPTGVRPVERVRFDFFGRFPSQAPMPSVRADFGHEHAHFQPGLTVDDRPVPCIVFGDLDEFMAVHGVSGLVEQTRVWLQQAAKGTLSEGVVWEPIRRDHVRDGLVCDADWVRTLIRGKAGYAFLTCAFRRRLVDEGGLTETFQGRLGQQTRIADRLQSLLCQGVTGGVERGVALVMWADGRRGGEPIVEGVFRPDDVTDMTSFAAQVERFRMSVPLKAALLSMSTAAKDQVRGIAPIPVILLVRRPRRMPDSDSAVELITYLVQLSLPSGEPACAEVRPVACYDEIRPTLLRRLSGEPKAQAWALLGAGSLGSKIALHRARSGAAPSVCADNAWMGPHNAARHALYPILGEAPLGGWLERKVDALLVALRSLNQEAMTVAGDHRDLVLKLAEPITPKVRWLLNTTGSTIAREWLASPEAYGAPRTVEAGLFDFGNLGFVTVEGSDRNPDCAELMGALLRHARTDADLKARLFNADGQLGFVPIGQGCGSATMIMSDAHLSAMAAPIAEIVAGLESRSTAGRVHLLSRDGFGLRHEAFSAKGRTRIPLEGLEDWSVSIAPEVLTEINREVARWPSVETGGVLIGWGSPISRRLYVLDLVEAPPDSVRSPNEFVLGIQGLASELNSIVEETAGNLYCLGTWHSHLGLATPSTRDWASAAAIGEAESRPMALLIRGTDGFRAITTTAAIEAALATAQGRDTQARGVRIG